MRWVSTRRGVRSVDPIEQPAGLEGGDWFEAASAVLLQLLPRFTRPEADSAVYPRLSDSANTLYIGLPALMRAVARSGAFLQIVHDQNTPFRCSTYGSLL